ncbi:hypothetical protein HanHA300_Chr06g0222141 [Helianthus annuus]|nr:hypothetical protein HanHA300_Chr06g0222141 [Helianthus annuus]KAJ0574421.1 hypothetical protein HanHA89_Chr06g0237971 [Helianthus annuus]KAJ0738758.1 hypothetical protein HanLR1_Chr06g0221931 [Helianthus annuus]
MAMGKLQKVEEEDKKVWRIEWFCYGGVGLKEQSKENGILAISAGYKSLERENKLVGFFLVQSYCYRCICFCIWSWFIWMGSSKLGNCVEIGHNEHHIGSSNL